MIGVLLSVALFFLAAFFEICGGYLVWQWLREKRGILWGVMGCIGLFFYGIIQTFQPAHFGRVYATYGGIFIVSSLIWGQIVDGTKPDKYDILGGIIALVGVMIIMYWPR